MERSPVEVELSREAVEEFEDIQNYSRGLFPAWGIKYLGDLAQFPNRRWVDIRKGVGGDYFKADNHVPFDIQGKIIYGPTQKVEKVLITRFRIRSLLSSPAFNGPRDDKFVKNQIGG